MTKDFCDKCKKEIENREFIRISFWRNYTFKGPEWPDDNILLCQGCCKKMDKQIKKVLPFKANIPQPSLS